MKLWSIRLIYERAANEAGVRTAVSAHPSAVDAIAWLQAQVAKNGELPGYRCKSETAEDITDYAYAFVAANPRGPQ